MIERHFHDIFFNGKSLADFGVHVSGDGTFNSPEKDFETVEVPGRNGDLHIFNDRFKNIDVTYKAFIVGDEYYTGSARENFVNNMRELRSWLMSNTGYCRLEDTYHPDEYRMALFKGPIETEALFLIAGEFDLSFNCKPQRFLKNGEKSEILPNKKNLINPTAFTALPLFRVYGAGTITITHENRTVHELTILPNPYRYIDIDSELSDAYYGSNNCNSYIEISNYDFPKLLPGKNRIIYSGFTQVEITPRWWLL